VSKKADVIIHNALVLTMDEEFKQYDRGAVVVQDDKIIAVGLETDILDAYSASESVDAGGKVLMPGLINAHTHVPMALLRGLADDLRLDVWLLGYIMPVEREFVSPEFVRLGTLIGCTEFIRSGITTFNDMYYYEEDVAKAAAEAGMRAVLGQTVLKFPSPDASTFEDSLAMARAFIEGWKGHALIVPAVAPHAPFTCTPEILKACAALAVEFDVPLHIHISETEIEVANMRKENDMPVIPYIKKQNLFDAKVIAAHCVHIDRGEMHTLHHHGAGVAHNPSSNMKLASGAAPIKEMLEIGLNVGIGTDGPASNNDLDMFEEVRLASFLAKLSTNDPTTLPARDAVLMATRMGAQALHIGGITGSLEVGKRADLILVDIQTLHNSPQFKRDENGIYAQIVFAAKSTDVNDVMVNGRWLMRDKALLTIQEDELLQEAAAYAERIDTFLLARESSVLSKLIEIGGATQEESFEVQIKVAIKDAEAVKEKLLTCKDIEILYHRHYHEFDTYFEFDDPAQGRVRHREDEFINERGEVEFVRPRLTLIGETHEHEYQNRAILSRSRYLAPGTQSLRFLREYFQPSHEVFVEKDRLRWHINYKDMEFYVHIDKIIQPELGHYLEVKSRTWSLKDAEHKAELIYEIAEMLGAPVERVQAREYAEIVKTLD
jgi:5-methylthioadenosine/S-adenosylhomocysteine deaminase